MQRGAGKQLQDFGEEFSAKVQETAENVRDSLQGAQSDASSKASSAARTGQSKLEQGADDAEGLGAKIGNQAENLKVCTVSLIYYPTTFQSCIQTISTHQFLPLTPVWCPCTTNRPELSFPSARIYVGFLQNYIILRTMLIHCS